MSDHELTACGRLPELPSLESGTYLLETDGEARGPLHALVVDRVLTARGTAYWVDAHGHATTQPLARLAPSSRVLDRIRVARGFTPYQHCAILETLAERVDEDAALIVAPAFDGPYRDEGARDERTALLTRALALLARCGREHDVPVLLTRVRDDGFSAPVANAASEVVRCEETRQGPRFVADSFETLVYPASDGHVQTTLSFWTRILEARRPLYERVARGDAGPAEVSVRGSH